MDKEMKKRLNIILDKFANLSEEVEQIVLDAYDNGYDVDLTDAQKETTEPRGGASS